MARLPRIDVPGLAHHLVVRGNDRMALFRTDGDRLVLLSLLAEAMARARIDIHAYVLMTNHVHLLATAAETGELSGFMHRVGTQFARLMNKRWQRTGTLFEGRFRSHPVGSGDYLVTCMRYIDLNPVRAGLARHPGDYAWSSYRANAGVGESSLALSPHEAYVSLGETKQERAAAYRGLCDSGLPESTLQGIRQSLQKRRVLGGPAFAQALLNQVGTEPQPRPRGRPPGKSGSGSIFQPAEN